MKQNTPLKELIEWIEKYCVDEKNQQNINFIKLKAIVLLEQEKQMVVDANRDGVDMVVDKKPFITGEEYYTTKYNQLK